MDYIMLAHYYNFERQKNFFKYGRVNI